MLKHELGYKIKYKIHWGESKVVLESWFIAVNCNF